MLHIALEPTDLYGFSSLNDYQFGSQGILCLLPLLYIFHYIQYFMDIVMFFILYFITFVLSRFRASLFAENYSLI
jgi:hypothetical protein